MTDKKIAYLAAVLVGLFAGFIPIGSKLVIADVSPLVFSFFIHLFQLPFLLIAMFLTGEKLFLPTSARSKYFFAGIVILGLVGIALVNFGYSGGLALEGAFLSRLEPLFAGLLGFLLFREGLHRNQWLGMLMAFIGLFLFFSSGLMFSVFSIFFLAAALSWGLQDVLAKEIIHQAGPGLMNLGRVLFGSAVLGFFVFPEILPVLTVHWISFLLVGFLYFGTNYLGFYAMKELTAAEAVSFYLMGPVISLLLSAVWLHEPISGAQLAGGAVILLGLGLVSVYAIKK
ncbi:MAG: DMT family transporter [Candidatus Diapherotrites archaeon]|nr:DMT family transporter [Candidatus Diapherotrites archaeon]